MCFTEKMKPKGRREEEKKRGNEGGVVMEHKFNPSLYARQST